MAWAESFDRHIRAWIRARPEEAAVWDQYRATGYRVHEIVQAKVPEAAVGSHDEVTAYWSAFRYQRLHADSFVALLSMHQFADAVTGDVLVLDIGCGAGTAGIAVAEALPLALPGVVRYAGVDHNPTLCSLAEAMLNEILPLGSQMMASPDLESVIAQAIEWAPSASPPLVACSYVFNQPTVTVGAALRLADVVVDLAAVCNEPLRVCVTDASGKGDGRYLDFFSRLRSRVTVRSVVPAAALTHDARYPNLYATEAPMIVRQRSFPTVRYRLLRIDPS